MKKGYEIFKTAISVLLLLCMLSTFACASGNIKEDSIYEDLPAVNPQAGIERNIQVDLYYRLSNEDYIVPVSRNVSIEAGERAEEAIVRTLIGETPTIYSSNKSLFPDGTSVSDVMLDGGILYVTLSGEFIDDSLISEAEAQLLRLYEDGQLTQEEYDAKREAVVETAYNTIMRRRRLAVYSIVNSITAYNSDVRVQILVDMENSGSGKRLATSIFGLEENTDEKSKLIEPMRYDEKVIASGETLVYCMLMRLVNAEYEQAYVFFGDSGGNHANIPDYEKFKALLDDVGGVNGFKIYSESVDDEQGSVSVKVDMSTGLLSGDEKEITEAWIQLKFNGDVNLIDYDSFRLILKGNK